MCKKTTEKGGKPLRLLLAGTLFLACGWLPVHAVYVEAGSISETISETISENEAINPEENWDEAAAQAEAEEFVAQTSERTEHLESILVAYDPSDGVTKYIDFYKVTMPAGEKITEKPENPKREGHVFKGWYGHLDENKVPVLWNFEENTVEKNTTLWAAWAENVLVAYDPSDGVTQYTDFYKVTMPAGEKITEKPETPKREGHVFKGWYGHLDVNGAPVLWNFEENTVEKNTTLWAAWAENVLVAYDPSDGVTQYTDFYKVTMPAGEKITEKPENPKREGYVFKGWYGHLDVNGAPVLWNFEENTVEKNTTLWAAWEKKSTSGGGSSGGGSTGGETPSGGGNISGGGNTGGGEIPGGEGTNGTNGGNESVDPEEPIIEECTEIEDEKVPLAELGTSKPVTSTSTAASQLDDLPQTGDDFAFRSFLLPLCGISGLGMLAMIASGKRKDKNAL